MRTLLLAATLVLCTVSLSLAAKLDTSFTYSTIETEHFSIHYHQALEQAAGKVAAIAEETHPLLVREFRWQPAGKTQVVLIDNSDFINGLAVTIPYNAVYLQVVPPSVASTLGEYDDWLRVLFTHEYAHILSADPARGYSKVTRAIFGKPLPTIDPLSVLFFIATAPPNTFMPRWWHEGMATWAESKYTGVGRGKGTYYDMVFRSAVAEDDLPSVDQINGDVPYWPSGHLAYMYGYRLQRYIADTYGPEAAGKLTIAHSGRFPYLINRPPEDLFNGKDYSDIYRDMVVALKLEQRAHIKELSRVPFTPLTVLNDQGENLTNPRYSPDGSRIAFTRRDPNDHTSVVVTDASGQKVLTQFRRQLSDGSLSWSRDGKSLYFTQAEIERGFNVYQDLYVRHLESGETKRLTRGERLSDAQVAPDGRTAAAVVSSRGNQNLALLDLSLGEKAQPLPVTGYTLERVSSPSFSPDGRSICYVLTDNNGMSALRIYDTVDKTDRALFRASHTFAFPVWAPDGSSIYYISDETGVFNLFAYDLKGGASYQVSHLLTGAIQPAPSPDGSSLLLASYSSKGFKIARMEIDRSRWSLTRGPSLPSARTAYLATEAEANSAAAPTSSRYNAAKTLLPRFWLPRIYGDGSDQAVIGAFTAGADVLGYNTYALSAAYSDGRKRGYFSLTYLNDYFYPTLSVRAHNEPLVYSDLYQKGYDYWEVNRGAEFAASIPVNFLESTYRIKAGYELLDQKALSRLGSDGTFGGVPVFQGSRNNLFAGISYSSALKYPYSISSEEGCDLTFLYRYFGRDIGADQNLSEYSASYEQYLRLSKTMLPHQVLYLRMSGALADGDLQYGQQAFQIGGAPSEYNQYPLRGYPTRSMTGKYVATGTLEYRAPLAYPFTGPGTAPAFLEKVHGALFTDAGQVWDDNRSFHANETRVGAGAELRADMTIGYWAKVTPAIGFAHGFNRGGENQVYFTLYLGL